jgi:hypothetical protein
MGEEPHTDGRSLQCNHANADLILQAAAQLAIIRISSSELGQPLIEIFVGLCATPPGSSHHLSLHVLTRISTHHSTGLLATS